MGATSGAAYRSEYRKICAPDSLDKILNEALVKWESVFGTGAGESTLALRFKGLWNEPTNNPDNGLPSSSTSTTNPVTSHRQRGGFNGNTANTLKPFYGGVLKTMDGCIQFAMLTGVTKFGKVSVFSDLNNLEDLSMWNEYVTLCGVSNQEIHENLEEELHEFAKVQNMTYDEVNAELGKWYDGYHFTHNSIGIYNPFSLLNAFKRKDFGNYWFETGTPTYLVELLKRNHYDLERMANEETSSDVLNSIYGDEQPIPVIFQSGYLTIKAMIKNSDYIA